MLLRTRRGVVRDHLSLAAAGAAFFAMLALPPAATALVSIWALFSDPGRLEAQLALLDKLLPPDAQALIAQQMERIAGKAGGHLEWSAVLSLLLMFWAANQGTRAFMAAHNLVHRSDENRSAPRLILHSLLLTVLGVLVMGAALALVGRLPDLIARAGLPHRQSGLGLLRWPVLLAVVFGFYLLIGRFAPCRRPQPWRYLWPGAAAAALAWLAVSWGFSVYVARFGAFDAVYGSLGAVFALLLWVYLSIFVGLVGAKLGVELEREARRG